MAKAVDNALAALTENFVLPNAKINHAKSNCDICMERKSTFMIMKCKHKCCIDCYTKIDKCHMCRGPIFKVMKAEIHIKACSNMWDPVTFTPFYETTIKTPLYFTKGITLLEDTHISGYVEKIDFMLINKSYDIMQSIIDIYGFDVLIESYEVKRITYDHNLTT